MIPITLDDMQLIVWGAVLGFVFYIGFYPFVSVWKFTKSVVTNNND